MNSKLPFHLIRILCAILILSSVSSYGKAQPFKTYFNPINKFSFQIPKSWIVKFSKEQDGIICVPTSIEEKAALADCFEGIIFRLEIYNSSLDSTLLDNNYFKIDTDYYTSDRIRDSIKTEKIAGKTWKGIYHNNTCGIGCKDTGFHGAAGQCEFLYFAKDKTTICITTNGQAFEKQILERLLKTFRFF